MATYSDVKKGYLASVSGTGTQPNQLAELMDGLRNFMEWDADKWQYTDASDNEGGNTSKCVIRLDLSPQHSITLVAQIRSPANRKTGMFSIADVVVTVAGKDININPEHEPSIASFNKDASEAILALAIKNDNPGRGA